MLLITYLPHINTPLDSFDRKAEIRPDPRACNIIYEVACYEREVARDVRPTQLQRGQERKSDYCGITRL